MLQEILNYPVSMIALITGFAVMIIGLFGMLTNKNLIRIVLSFSIMDAGINVIIVAIGYIKNKTAPIIDDTVGLNDISNKVIDPIPSALVLTAIVIGLGVTALMLSYVIKMYKHNNSLSIDKCSELKW